MRFFLLVIVMPLGGCLRGPGDELNESGTTATASSTLEPEDISTGDPACGDGAQDPGEGCDDGNDADDDACPSGAVGQCKAAAVCGDGIVWTGEEQCDGGDGCSDCVLMPAECGNGVMEAGEACDDGNTEDADACPSGAVGKCAAEASCGDGITWADVEVCDDENTDETDACPSGAEGKCLAEASCGDGFVWAGEEACDDGNTDDTDACPSGQGACQAVASCGDGYVQTGAEDCDDKNAEDLDECSNACWSPRWAFVTSLSYKGNLGGITGANMKCQDLAEMAGLDGQYMAWLTGSDPLSAPVSRFDSSDFKGWYLLPTDPPSPVAFGWADLTSPNDRMPLDYLKSAITANETGGGLSGNAWTNTNVDGQQHSATEHCGEWTKDTDEASGRTGRVKVGSLDETWTTNLLSTCDFGVSLYCFQVGD